MMAISALATEPIRILLVDTDPGVRFAFADYLRTQGFVVDTAGSDIAAELRLRRERYHTMISDLTLDQPDAPGGIRLATQLLLLAPETVVCLLTRPIDAAMMREAERVADVVLFRPRPLADIAQIVLTLIAQRTMKNAPQPDVASPAAS
ncbi:MAG: response regulator [Gemmatimonadota bacterium]|nr:response regulator [Gemmatimonadota bacterium]